MFVLATFAVTEPIYSLLSERTVFFSDLGIGLRTTLWLILEMSVVVPSLCAAGLWGIGRLWPRAASAFQGVAIFFLLGLIALPAMKRAVLLPGVIMIGFSLVAAMGAAYLYSAFRPFRSVVTVCTPAIFVFPLMLLWGSPLSDALFPKPLSTAGGPANGTPVVLVVFDELCGMTLMNDDREIDGDRFPHFAELARDATWFRNASTVHTDTAQAVPAILSGKIPAVSGQGPSFSDLPQNLFTVLQWNSRYELAAFEPLSRLAPENLTDDATTTIAALGQVFSTAPTLLSAYLYFLSPLDLHEKLPPLPSEWFGLKEFNHVAREKHRGVFRYGWGADRRGQFEHFLECLSDSPKPTLFFIHDVLPHVNWCYLPSGRRYIPDGSDRMLLDFNTRDSMIGFWGADDQFVAQCQQRYLLQVEFVDSLVGRLLVRLKETGLYDRCLLIVMADHGVCFKAKQPRRGITSDNPADILSVPLFIKKPGQQTGGISDKNVQTTDILPTIADVLDLDLKISLDGRSVFDTAHPERPEKTVFDSKLVARTYPAAILASSTVPEELRSRFGRGDDPAALFRIGPYPELVGCTADSLPISDESPVEIELLRSGSEYSEDANTLVPCYIEGRVLFKPGKELPTLVAIAVAVNGTIHAVTRTCQLDGWRDKWAAMLPESAYRIGANDIQFYVVNGKSPQITLTHCHATAVPAPRH